MMRSRYEFRIDGWLSERIRCAFDGMRIESIPRQTIISVEVANQPELSEVLDRCGTMGLRVVSVRRLPDTPRPDTPG